MDRHETRNIESAGSSTIGRVYYSAWLAGEGRYMCRYYYFVQNKKYYGLEIHYHKNVFIGDFFEIAFDSQKPHLNKINLSRKITLEMLEKNYPSENRLFNSDE